MIIDFHTHIFPPDVRENRDEYIRRDPTFAEMYSDPKAKIATAPDLLESMERAGVDVSVALAFAWWDDDESDDGKEQTARHNDYILNAAAKSGGRLIPFTMLSSLLEFDRCVKAGARGLGELRPENQGWFLDEGLTIVYWRLKSQKIVPLVHVTENGDRDYPGRRGCELARFERYTRNFQDIPIVGAHFGGGIYWAYEFVAPDVYVDTAAQPFLYPGEEALRAVERVPPDRLLLGSDFPLISQERQIEELKRVIKDPERLDLALGGNAARLLGITL